ncbi:MAG: hypothetical protein ABSC64_11535 [Candidatus Korobacteraceae bacterium]
MNDETISRTFLSEINFDFDIAKAAVASVKYQGFRPIADAFWTNVEGAMNLLQLPHFLLSYSAMREKQTLIFLDVYLPLANRGLDYTDKTSKKRVDDEVARRLSEWKAQEGHTGELALDADKHLAGLLDMEMMQRQLRMVVLSLISATWTAFEVLAGDAWQFALNARPTEAAQSVPQRLFPGGTPEGISAKGIPLWLAAKYNFDLRQHIGDILKLRIDFSDVNEIRKGYVAAFGEKACLQDALEDKNLLILEATRHLVVHRGAIVDEKYNKVTGQSFPLHQPLPLEPAFVSAILHVAIVAGSSIVTFLDEWLVNE